MAARRRKIPKYVKDNSIEKEMHSLIEQQVKGRGVAGLSGIGMVKAPKGSFSKKKHRIAPAPKKKDFPNLISARCKGFGEMKSRAAKNLISMTARDFGEDREAWQSFWEENRHLEIKDWRISGLREKGLEIEGLEGRELIGLMIDNLIHDDGIVRESVYAILREKVGSLFPYDPRGSEKVRIKGYACWKDWFDVPKSGVRESGGKGKTGVINSACPRCSHILKIPAEYAGKRVKCMNCGEKLRVRE